MHRPPYLLALLLAPIALSAAPARAGDEVKPQVHHVLEVGLTPADHVLRVEDRVTFPGGLQGLDVAAGGGLRFLLHAGLEVSCPDAGFVVEPWEATEGDLGGGEPDGGGGAPISAYRLRPVDGAWPAEAEVRLVYRGAIHHPPVAEAEEYARYFARSPGTIGRGRRGALPRHVLGPLLRRGPPLVPLAVRLPAGWDAVSQGRRTGHERSGGRGRPRRGSAPTRWRRST